MVRPKATDKRRAILRTLAALPPSAWPVTSRYVALRMVMQDKRSVLADWYNLTDTTMRQLVKLGKLQKRRRQGQRTEYAPEFEPEQQDTVPAELAKRTPARPGADLI